MTHRMLLVLDFSGVLSLAAVCFGMPDRLDQALRHSGLWELGVDGARYWSDVVKPTWEVGSTTRTPYAYLVAQRVQSPHVAFDDALRCAEQFVQAYMQASVIDPVWRALFDGLQAAHSITPLIATDHYAEATAHIAQQIAAMGWRAAALQTDASGRVLMMGARLPPFHPTPSRSPTLPTLVRIQNVRCSGVACVPDLPSNRIRFW